MPIVVNDRIFGRQVIASPALLDLLKSKPLQRLKGICQFGVPDKYYHLKNYTRYEHSVGVMLLLRNLKASDVEQVAGLLHDVSHTAFSHVIDWVINKGNGGSNEEYQDSNHLNFLEETGLDRLLRSHGYNPMVVGQTKKFTLLETELPALCADRVDYALREFPLATARRLLSRLRVSEGRIVLADKASAENFAELFLSKQINHWGSLEAVTRFYYFAQILRKAIENSTLIFEDFWSDDDNVLKKIEAVPEFKLRLSALRRKPLHIKGFSRVIMKKKFRYVDPCFIDGSSVVRLSDCNPRFVKALKKAKLQNLRGVRIPILI